MMNNSTVAYRNFSSQQACSEIVPFMLKLALTTISATAVVGNILIVLSFVKARNLRTSTNYYIVNMAISDLLYPFFNWPLYASEGMLTPNILISQPWVSFACKLGMYFRAVSQAVSVISLVLIALDRFIAVVYPLKATILNGKIRVFFLFVSWLIPLCYGTPYILFSLTIKLENHTFCRFMMSDVNNAISIFNSVGFSVFYLVPLITITGLYSIIVRTLKTRPHPGITLITNRATTKDKRRQENQRILKISKAIVSLFFLCWTPMCVYFLLKKFKPSLFPTDRCMLLVSFSFYICPSLSTGANPIILFVFSTKYNQALKNLLSPMLSLCTSTCGCKVVKRKQSAAMAIQVTNM
ncbi:neuropeptides capa receptor-like [Acropora millepora]|uniref:neuropeptides capa receptor-like n=1 Tax=Acropora millepora TaxID=45264 RepID=UPI001CF5ACE7|nr:neuropeptides capa receptor-like [Acropora millepora]